MYSVGCVPCVHIIDVVWQKTKRIFISPSRAMPSAGEWACPPPAPVYLRRLNALSGLRSIFVTRNFVTRTCGLRQKSQFLIFLIYGRILTRSTWVSGGVSGCLGVSGGVSAHRSLRIDGSPRRTIILICPPECVFGPPEYGESMGPQQPPEYAGGPKMYHFWAVSYTHLTLPTILRV